MEEYNPVGWFEIAVVDLDRAEHFYQTVFGYSFDRQPETNGMTMSWFPMDPNKKGGAGSLVKGDYYQPSTEATGSVVYFTTPDFDSALGRVEEAGGAVIVPKQDIGEHGYIAWIKDTEGNTVALHTTKENG